jgi:hypothetical protein
VPLTAEVAMTVGLAASSAAQMTSTEDRRAGDYEIRVLSTTYTQDVFDANAYADVALEFVAGSSVNRVVMRVTRDYLTFMVQDPVGTTFAKRVKRESVRTFTTLRLRVRDGRAFAYIDGQLYAEQPASANSGAFRIRANSSSEAVYAKFTVRDHRVYPILTVAGVDWINGSQLGPGSSGLIQGSSPAIRPKYDWVELLVYAKDGSTVRYPEWIQVLREGTETARTNMGTATVAASTRSGEPTLPAITQLRRLHHRPAVRRIPR